MSETVIWWTLLPVGILVIVLAWLLLIVRGDRPTRFTVRGMGIRVEFDNNNPVQQGVNKKEGE